jgi:hypothetical protein
MINLTGLKNLSGLSYQLKRKTHNGYPLWVLNL